MRYRKNKAQIRLFQAGPGSTAQPPAKPSLFAKFSPGSHSSLKSIAETRNRDDPFGLLRQILQLLTETSHVYINRAAECAVSVSPNLSQDLISRKSRSRMFKQVAQELEFPRRQIDRLAVSGYLGADLFEDRKSTRLNSSHTVISYAVFCL